MAKSEHKRQKARDKKKARRKAAKLAAGRSYKLLSEVADLKLAAGSPIHECLVFESLFEVGIGNALIARKLWNGRIAVAVFLIDVFCLGVKDVFYRTLTPRDYRDTVLKIESSGCMITVEPSCARKLVEGGVHFAALFELQPHKDYRRAAKIFGDIDPAECSTEYHYGRAGKPLYVRGPNDSEARAQQIVKTLERHGGPGGYEFIAHLDSLPDEVER